MVVLNNVSVKTACKKGTLCIIPFYLFLLFLAKEICIVSALQRQKCKTDELAWTQSCTCHLPQATRSAHTAKTTGHKDCFHLRHTVASINSTVQQWCWHTHLELAVVVTFTHSSYYNVACITHVLREFEPRSWS